MRQRLRLLYQLTKPGIVYGNVVAAIAAALFAMDGAVDGWVLLTVVLGIGLVVASACVVNNYTDRAIDARMERTRHRPSVAGKFSGIEMLLYASVLGVVGFCVLATLNMATVVLGVIAYVFYVGIYGVAKRKTPYSTIIGAVPGALPPMAGYVAVADSIDGMAWLLFFIMFAWQMPHFYAIGLRRFSEYQSAKLPILSVVLSKKSVRNHMYAWMALYVLLSLLPALLGYTGKVFLILMLATGVGWIVHSRMNEHIDTVLWARGVFLDSLKVFLLYCLALVGDAWLP